MKNTIQFTKIYIMRTHFRLLFIFFLLPVISLGQMDSLDIFQLKDGRIKKGNLITPQEGTIIIRTLSNDTLIFQKHEVTRMKTQPANPHGKGYYNSFSIGKIIDPDIYKKDALSFQIANGYRFRCGCSAGIILGVEYFKDPLLPAFLDLRYQFGSQKLKKFLYVKGGPLFHVKLLDRSQDDHHTHYYHSREKYQSGYTISPGIGIMIPINQEFMISLSTGYRYQELHYRYRDYHDHNVYRYYVMNRLVFRAGIAF